jgi:hypothetical protein
MQPLTKAISDHSRERTVVPTNVTQRPARVVADDAVGTYLELLVAWQHMTLDDVRWWGKLDVLFNVIYMAIID